MLLNWSLLVVGPIMPAIHTAPGRAHRARSSTIPAAQTFSLRRQRTTLLSAGAYSLTVERDTRSGWSLAGRHGQLCRGSVVVAWEPWELLLTQLDVERIGVRDGDTLVRLPGERPDGIPRFYVAALDHAVHRFYRWDVPPAVRDELAALPLQQARSDHATVRRILARHAPCDTIWSGVSYHFPPHGVTAAEYADVVALGQPESALIQRFDPELTSFEQPVYAVVCDGEIVSACVSTRETARAGEAWVQTAPAHRGRGYARRVTAAWGHALTQRGKIAYYSHAQDNAASAGVARSLGLTAYLRDVGYS